MQPISRIFNGIPTESVHELLEALQTEKLQYAKGSLLLEQGEINRNICLLESGRAHAVRYAPEGREVDYALLRSGDLFGDALALSRGYHSPVSIYADEPCTVIRFSYRALLGSAHPYAKQLLQNLAEELTQRFFQMQRRIHYLTRPTLREKILAYLHDLREDAGQDEFTVPLDRYALSSYLYCDRSALCRELSRLQKEGIIRYHRSHFQILVSAKL